jgi:hypothetical protein
LQVDLAAACDGRVGPAGRTYVHMHPRYERVWLGRSVDGACTG